MVEITRLHAELNRLFSSVIENQHSSAATWDPSTDVLQSETQITVILEVPGMEAGDLSLGFQSGNLHVRGHKRHDGRPRRPARFLCMERFFGEFVKIIPLPAAINAREAKATLEDGVLTICLPRVPDQRRRLVEIPVEQKLTRGES